MFNNPQVNALVMGENDHDDIGMILAIFEANRHERIHKYKMKRLNWNEHIQCKRHAGSFAQKYLMQETSFNKLGVHCY